MAPMEVTSEKSLHFSVTISLDDGIIPVLCLITVGP